MPLNPKLEARLNKISSPSTRLEEQFAGKDLTIITDQQGHAVTLFIGKRQPDGSIKGERYVRRLKFAPDGVTLQSSHWEAKGKVTRS
ncbi:hypothetical protein [Rufibacter psychrotolerans]|uniref:hypothetical protein n=1 Tax=Rufibacter psychrotolerans TaxID=2812556 RepID=UPI001966EE34|nr:hypothetical protein [Rufibacter sp. SYSU D00308]